MKMNQFIRNRRRRSKASLAFERRTTTLGIRAWRSNVQRLKWCTTECGIRMSKHLTNANRPWCSNVRRLNLPIERPRQHSNARRSNNLNFSWIENGFSQLKPSNPKPTPNLTKVSRVQTHTKRVTITQMERK